MDVAKLPASNTWRWFFRYQVGNDIHTISMRSIDGSYLARFQTQIDTFMTNLSPVMWLSSFVDVSYSAAGSNVRLPADRGIIKTTYGAGVPAPNQTVYGLAFPGRSQAGAKARIYPIGTKLTGDANFRYTAAESAEVGAAIATLRAAPSGLCVAIDGQPVTWYNYATSKQNDHFVKNRRGG